MAIYTINDIEQLSGIKAHTLRIWEKRYGIINPKRTAINKRYYEDSDLQLIMNIALLNKNGYKISKISQMSEEEFQAKVEECSDIYSTDDERLDALFLAMLDIDEYRFSKIIDHIIEDVGFEKCMDQIIYPFMDRLSVMWMAGNTKEVHEKFVANLIRRKLISAINDANKCGISGPKFILYLPQGETHELSLLYLQYMLCAMGVNAINLGTDLSLIDALEGVSMSKAKYVFTLFNDSFAESPLQPYIDELSHHLGKDVHLLLSGQQLFSQNISVSDNVKILSSLAEVRNEVRVLLELA